jgi:hypothetical protein
VCVCVFREGGGGGVMCAGVKDLTLNPQLVLPADPRTPAKSCNITAWQVVVSINTYIDTLHV